MPNYYNNMQDYSRRNSGRNMQNRGGYYRNANPYNASSCQRSTRSNENCRCENERHDERASCCEKERCRDERPSCSVNEKCHNERPSCSVKEKYDALMDLPIAMAYVPWQYWDHIYEIEKGFCRGTIFKELDLPFEGKGGCR